MVVVVEKDKERIISSPLEDIRLRIVELVFGPSRGRNFKLQIDLKRREKFITVFEQHEVGKWTIEKFDELFTAYCEAKQIPHKRSPTRKWLF